jgi:hypothetical protein
MIRRSIILRYRFSIYTDQYFYGYKIQFKQDWREWFDL